MIIRKIGKLLRGKATPFQIISATVIGGLLGAIPGFTQGPLLLVSLLFLLIILNANLFLGGLTLLLVKLISLLLLPVYFQIGMTMLEGGFNGVVTSFVNAPVTAWFGLEYYVMIPSLLTGGLLGLILGVVVSRSLASFRKQMASLESGSERYQQYSSKWWVKLLAWLFIGGLKGKKSWTELSEKKKGLPVRPLGVIFVVALSILGFIGIQFLDTTIVTSIVRDQLEKANGATVDLAGIEILPGENRIVINALELANPEKLDTNRFSSTQISADFSGMNILAKKVVIDELHIAEPKSGEPRKLPGTITTSSTRKESKTESGEAVQIDDYLGQASVWRERLQTAKRMYDRLAPYMKKEGDDSSSGEEQLSWREQLLLQAKELGYANVKSASLISDTPQLWIRVLSSDNMILSGSDDRFAIGGTNLSTQPFLLDESGTLMVSRLDGELEVQIGLPSMSNPNQSSLEIRYDGMEIDEMAESVGSDFPMSGGTMDIMGKGTITGGILDLPLTVTLNDTVLSAFGTSMPVDDFPLQVGVSGTLDNPGLTLPKDAIKDAVKAGGKKKIEGLIKEEGGDQLKKLFNLGG